MNTIEINNILSNLNSFIGTFPCDVFPEVKKKPAGMIFNTDTSNGGGEHWIAVWMTVDGTSEYFDSFGFPPLVKQTQDFLSNHSPNGFTYNNKTLQHPMAVSCGPFCVAFIIAKSLGQTFVSFVSKFSFNLAANEELLKKSIEQWLNTQLPRSKKKCRNRSSRSVRS